MPALVSTQVSNLGNLFFTNEVNSAHRTRDLGPHFAIAWQVVRGDRRDIINGTSRPWTMCDKLYLQHLFKAVVAYRLCNNTVDLILIVEQSAKENDVLACRGFFRA